MTPDQAHSTPHSSGDDDDPELDALLVEVARAPAVMRLPGPGDVVDERYEIASALGRGGMGHVFAARDLRTGKDVALKWMVQASRLGSESERRTAIARFLREARIAATITHPNIVDVYDVKVAGGAPYLVMERLRGETLRTRLDRGRLGWDEALAVILPAMRGVAALHRAGIVHRDLKPDNIFLCAASDDAPATTKVLDFGIARALALDPDTLTRTGAVLGTPAYMPLEQLRGANEIDATADVYALGVVLYEALAGVRPFEARTAADQAVAQATGRPTPLDERVAALTRRRADVIMKALAREPRARHASVTDFVAALEAAGHTRARYTWRVALAAVVALVASLATWWALAEHRTPTRDAPTNAHVAPPITPPSTSPIAPPSPAPDAPAPAEQIASPPPRTRIRRTNTPRAEDAPQSEPEVPVDHATRLRPEDF